MISILAPSRSRPHKSYETITKWLTMAKSLPIQVVVSIDSDDPFRSEYIALYGNSVTLIVSSNSISPGSAVKAINRAAEAAKENIMIVVSDDSDPIENWDEKLLNEVEGKTDWILKVKDGIQDWILTQPILDRAYYNRKGYIYDPDFKHMFCDTWLTVQADISGRKLTSNLMFKHLNDTIKDDVRKRSDATWDEGQRTFIQKLKQTPVEDLRKITDQSMKNWIRTHAGIRL